MSLHPARLMTFKELSAALGAAREEGLVTESGGPDGLRLYCYSRGCVYDRLWSDITLMARGLVLDIKRQSIVATPFPKFFNVGEGTTTIPDMEFETFEKLDGSLIIVFHDGREWRTATKGSLNSEQAQWAARWLAGRDLSVLERGATYLAEAIYPENRIVVHYDDAGLVLLAAYDEGGEEFSYAEICDVADRLGWKVAKRHAYASVSDLLAMAHTLPANEEGFVLRFRNGLRLKVKGDEYRRIHALISRVTPLAMWEAMQAGDDLDAVRRELPEEFWADFDNITATLRARVDSIVCATQREADSVAGLSDKDVGLRLGEFPAEVRGFIFPYRKSNGDLLSGKTRQSLFRAVRPTGNRLDGYVPSYAMNRVFDEAV